MPTIRAASALLASTALWFASASMAIDVDPPAETASPATSPSKLSFGHWFGRSAAKVDAPAPVVEREVASETSSIPEPNPAGPAQHAGDLVVSALGLLGIQYRRGGNTPESGFDCSGMVRYVYQ